MMKIISIISLYVNITSSIIADDDGLITSSSETYSKSQKTFFSDYEEERISLFFSEFLFKEPLKNTQRSSKSWSRLATIDIEDNKAIKNYLIEHRNEAWKRMHDYSLFILNEEDASIREACLKDFLKLYTFLEIYFLI